MRIIVSEWTLHLNWSTNVHDLVHLYFLCSPFCAPDSNNKIIELHAQTDEQSSRIIADRYSFEDRLRSMTGIEYMIVDGPDPRKPETHGNPVWVVRKQRREKEHGQPDRVTILATYYAIGERIYQAPSLYDILKNGLDMVTLQLKELFDTAYKMQRFSPAEGYSYIKPDSKKAGTAEGSTQTSRVGSPVSDTASQQLELAEKSEETNEASTGDDALLWESLQKTQMYMDEYMDANPLQGEPGSMFFTSTHDHVRSQNKRAQEAAAAEASKQASQAASRTSSTGSTPQPPPIKTEGLPRKGSKAMSPLSATTKTKRRKSKAPTSPSAPKSPP